MRHLFTSLMIFSILTLTACGQKGPLYLPDAKSTASQEQDKG